MTGVARSYVLTWFARKAGGAADERVECWGKSLPDREPGREQRISRRAALKLGAGASAVAASAPYLAKLGSDSRVFDLSGAEPAMARIAHWPVPRIVTRAQWGANEALRKPGQEYDTVVQKIIVHHTASPNSITDYAGLCRGILEFETSGEYIDIAYNWMIDPNGHIYEGRWAKDYKSGEPHIGELDGANVRGGHALYHNSRTIGIALLGTYDTVSPPAPMLNSLVTLLAWKCARWGISPHGQGLYLASNGLRHNLYNICGHRDTYATDCPGQRTEPMLPTIRSRVADRISASGYWIASAFGQVVPFGGLLNLGDASRRHVTGAIVGIAGHPEHNGYWMFSADGSVYGFGNSHVHGSMYGRRLNAPIVGMAPTITGDGYWLVGRDGGIFCFGDARYHGSTGGRRLNSPVLGLTPTATGKGYWIFARDGGIFSFGDARYHGSTGGLRLRQPIVGMAARPQGDGYWLIAGDGGVFNFGNAPFRGSGVGPTTPYVGMLPTASGNGYILLRKDGAVHVSGDAKNLGNAVGKIAGGAVGIAGRPT